MICVEARPFHPRGGIFSRLMYPRERILTILTP